MGRNGGSKLEAHWIYGLNPVLEALRAGRRIESLFISAGRHRLDEIKKEAEQKGIPSKTVDPVFFQRFGKGHQGIAAKVSGKEYLSLSRLIDLPTSKGEVPFFFILDCLEDPRNLGAILRVADAAGVHGVVLQSHRSVTLNSVASKVSAGAVEYVPVAVIPNIKHAIRKMRERGIRIVGAEISAERTLWETDFSEPVALVLGSEGKGLRKTVQGLCDILVRVPMKGKVNSLNVSVAAGIFSFEVLRQRAPKNQRK